MFLKRYFQISLFLTVFICTLPLITRIWLGLIQSLTYPGLNFARLCIYFGLSHAWTAICSIFYLHSLLASLVTFQKLRSRLSLISLYIHIAIAVLPIVGDVTIPSIHRAYGEWQQFHKQSALDGVDEANPAKVIQHLQKITSLSERTDFQKNLLSMASLSGDLPVMQALMDHEKFKEKNNLLSHCLFPAIKKRQAKAVKLLLQNGANPNYAEHFWAGDWTLLMYEIECMRKERDKTGRSPSFEILDILLEAGADPNKQRNTDGKTALIFAADKKIPEVIERLLKAGADPNIKDKDGETALSKSERVNDSESVHLLLEAAEKRSP